MILLAAAAFAAEPSPNADCWLTNGVFPVPFSDANVRTNLFQTLRAEAVAGKLQVKFEALPSLHKPRVIASADAPGHWPARDWRSLPMRRAGPNWLAELPVDSLDVPQIYLVAAMTGEQEVVSPMRLAMPRDLGLEKPTRLFWAFLEGFEQGAQSWRAKNSQVHTGALARSGRSALSVTVPSDRQSATLTSTRLRGWYLQEHGADGVALWLRTRSGTASAAFTLAGHAFSTNQILSRKTETTTISTNWTKVRLTFESFPRPPLADLDLLAIEFAAEPGTEILLDDVHLLGRWREDF